VLAACQELEEGTRAAIVKLPDFSSLQVVLATPRVLVVSLVPEQDIIGAGKDTTTVRDATLGKDAPLTAAANRSVTETVTLPPAFLVLGVTDSCSTDFASSP
jgi:hypothetical protein